MAGKEANLFVKNWMTAIEVGIKARKKYSSIDHWDEYRAQYRGEFNMNPDVQLNLVYSTGKSLVPRIYFKVPRVAVTPARPEFAGHARVVEALDNYLIKEVALKLALKRAAYQGYCCGTGVLKIGYDSEFGFVPKYADEEDDYASVTDLSKEDGESKIEFNQNIKPGMPWALSMRPEMVVVPFGYENPEDLPWVCFIHIRPLKDVQEDIKYKNTKDLKGGLVPSFIKGSGIIRKSEDLFNKVDPYVLLYEIRDARKKRMYVIAEDKVILDEEDELQIDGLPVEFIRFNEDLEYFWGISDVKILQPQQKEANEIKQQAYKNRRYGILKFLYKKGVIKEEQLDALLSDDINDIGAGVEVDGESLQADIMALMPHSLTTELEKDKQMVLSDARESTGMSRNSQGEYIPMTSKTATEAEFVDAGVSVRIDDRRDHMADVLTNVIRKFNQFTFKHWTTKKVVEVTGIEGAKYWVEYTGDQLAGEYYLNIDPEAGQPISRELKYKMAKVIFMELRNDPLIDQVALRRQLLRQYDWLDPEASLLLAQPTAMPGMQPPEGAPGMEGMPPGASPGGPPMGPQNPMPLQQFIQNQGGSRR